VTVFAVLAVLITWLPKLNEPGAMLSCGTPLVPLSETVCGEPGALSVMEMEALRVPIAEGVKVTWIVQLPDPAATVVQLFVCEKSAAFVPLIAIPLMLSVAVPGFVMIIDSAVLLVLMS